MANRFITKGIPIGSPVSVGVQIDAGHNLSTGLIGCWLLNENGGTQANDISGRNHPGTLTGVPIWTNEGLNFNGSSHYIENLDLASFDSLPEFTISAWVKPGTLATNKTICGKYGTAGMFLQTDTSSSARLILGFDGLNFVRTTTNNLVNGLWAHVVGTFSNSAGTGKHRIYVNGINIAITSAAGTPDNVLSTGASTGNFHIGKNNALGRFWSGKIWNVRAWNRALSAQEVMRLYTDPYAGLSFLKRRNITQQASAATTYVSNMALMGVG